MARTPDSAVKFLSGQARADIYDAFARDGTAVHLVFEIAHRRTGEMPGQAVSRGATAYDLVGKEGVKIVHGIDLRRGRVMPTKAKRIEPAFHLAEHITRFLAHRVG